MPVDKRLHERWKAWVDGGTICSEMEAASIFVLSSIYRTRAGGVMLMAKLDLDDEEHFDEDSGKDMEMFDINRVIKVAIEGLKVLIARDRKNR
jgi:uridine phosphorylase